LARPDYRRLREAVPIAAVWDDHDFGLNDAGADYAYKDASKQMFFDFWGIAPEHPRRQRGGIHDSFITGPVGARVQIILLDTRNFRDSWRPTDRFGQPGRERYLPDPDPARTILGPAQWQWLEDQLRQPADVRIVVSSYQLLADGHGWECWALFPAERQRFHDLVARTHANGIVLVSGDRHRAGIYRETRGTAYPMHELTSSAINMGSRTHVEEAGPNRLGPSFSENNVGMVTIDWQTRNIGFEIHDATGQTVLAHDFPIDSLRA
jgi:alkaline phosphatase D